VPKSFISDNIDYMFVCFRCHWTIYYPLVVQYAYVFLLACCERDHAIEPWTTWNDLMHFYWNCNCYRDRTCIIEWIKRGWRSSI